MDHDPHPNDMPRGEPETRPLDRTRHSRWLEGAAIVLFWTAVALLSVLRETVDPRSGEPIGPGRGEVLYTIVAYGLWAVLTPFVFWMTSRSVLHHHGWRRAVPLYGAVGAVVVVLIDLLQHLAWNALVPTAPPRPVSLRGIVGNPYLVGELSLYTVLLIAGLARAYFLRFQIEQREAIRLRMETAQLRAHLAEARLQALRMQINPHFLFNALHSIADGFDGDPPTARRMLARLSEMLRYAFEGMDTQEVPLRQELRFLKRYLEIQRFRFEDGLSVSQSVAADVQDALIPNLILQPLVENAVKHGLRQLDGPGRIELRAWREDETLHLEVCDNGPGLPASDGETTGSAPRGVGLRNTQERLQALYGSNQRCDLGPAPGGGVMVHLSLPFHTDADYRVVAVEEE